ncbi:UPF0182 family protein [Natranaerobius thermophilus]|uniref:UPF0182 protein Nther_0908 n=1 Tax=Natranaerobius thermophilus (strain ATCC BAA-1301 / DSM 18059 / JW/NM-WN-LF) TaxID=457570 RepID=B2A8C7_NATTJ|nr:UPF0182 family protein [Natranaerobius thermophilus]ACB84493.1 protein of unknown function UPF0182 [Natranaerobius thermophilus JW/NM-WN-LF]
MRNKFIILMFVVIFLLFSMGSIANFITEWQWFSSLGYLDLFVMPFVIQVVISIAAFIVGTVFVYFNLNTLSNYLLTPKEQVKLYESKYAELIDKFQSFGKWAKIGISAFLGLIWAGLFQGLWLRIVYFIHGEATGELEPVYNLDLAFYLFRLPMYQQIVTALISLVLFTLIAVVVIYLARGFLSWNTIKDDGGFPAGRLALRHINILLGIFLLVLALNAILGRYELLFSARGAVFGAGYTDIHVTRLVYTGLGVIGTLGFVISLANLKLAKYKLVFFSLGAFFLVSILGGVAGQIVQSTIVSPNELTRERPFIENHLEMTRTAYGLADIQEETWDVDVEGELEDDAVEEGEDIEEELEEIESELPPPELDEVTYNNMRLLDYRPVQDVYREAQEYRRYYHFNDVNLARYRIDDEYHQVMVSPREMDVDRIPSEAQTPVNRHLKYTHGYGLVMSPVGQFTDGGMPEYYLKDMPIEDDLGLGIERPELYFGELTNDFVLVNTDVEEFHYPGQEEVDLTYQGETGIDMSLLNRILFAIRERSSFLLFSQEYSSDSQILINRNIHDRVERLAPFLEYDNDPYIAAANGELYWIMDAYVTSDNFPYSRPFQGDDNYIKNPVKVVIDAYTGETSFYLVEDDEPLTQAISNAFPDLFSDPQELSDELRAQFRYPHNFFTIQANMLKNYHMTNPVVFYNREDGWDIPTESYGETSIEMEPYYATLNLPDTDEPEFVLMQPFTPVQRNNMISWLGARNDGDKYGELVLYRFPSGRHVYGPRQIDARIDQHPDISEQLSLWDGQGSRVIRGNLLVIPLEDGVLYIEPLYLQAEDSSYPEMRRVIAAWGDLLVMEDSLEEALDALGTTAEDVDTEVMEEELPEREVEEVEELVEQEFETIGELVDEALRLEREAEAAISEGNWGEYGELQTELSEILKELEERLDTTIEDEDSDDQ